MTDDMRRSGDALLTDIDKRLALVEQAQRLGERASEHRWTLVERSIEGLTLEVRKFAERVTLESSEPQASPAGRAMTQRVDALAVAVDEHEAFIQQAQGALRVARWALGTSLVSLIVAVLGIVRELAK